MASTASVEASTKNNSYHPPRPRKFAPLNPEKAKAAGQDLPVLKGVIFDVDGTLCLPQNHMFGEMRAALNITKSIDILDHIRTLSNTPDRSSPESSPQSRAILAIQTIERNAMTSQTAQPGLVELFSYLSSRSILTGLCTRNFPAPVAHLIANFLTPHGISFTEEEVITRDTGGVAPKPSPEGIWSIARHWTNAHGSNLDATVQEEKDGADDNDVLDVARKYLGSGLIMVGDSIDDMAAGYRAGAATVLLISEHNKTLVGHEYTDLAIKRLDDLIEVLEGGFVGDVSM